MNDREIFQRNLNRFLELSGKMQKDLADYVGAKYTTVSGWTRGISYPRADAMEKIANFFGVPTSRLIGESVDDLSLSMDESFIIDTYRSLPDPGKHYMLQQAQIARITFGEKSEVSDPIMKKEG